MVQHGRNDARRLRVLIADDHPMLLQGLAGLLQAQGFTVVGAAADGGAAVRLTRQCHPDVAVLGVAMPVLDGVEAARQIRRALPRTGVVLLSGVPDERVVPEALQVGVQGFVVKGQGIADLAQAIRDVSAGAIYISPCYSRMAAQPHRGGTGDGAALSPREREVLRLVAQGKTTREAAALLGIAVKTAECHRASVMHKLGIHETAGLVRYAIRVGLIVA